MQVLARSAPVPARTSDGELRCILTALQRLRAGDTGVRLPADWAGLPGDVAGAFNRMAQQLGAFAGEVGRVAREVGTQGQLGGQASVQGLAGTWRELADSVNSMASHLTAQVRNIAEVTKAVAAGDLSRKITVPAQGEILDLKNTINTMVDQLRGFAAEVTRVAHEVGAEGRLGGQADVPGAAGTWKALTENVNQLAAHLTVQVRAIADIAMQVNTEQDWLKTSLTRELQDRQRELQHTNEALQEKARLLAHQNQEVERKNREIEQARQALEDKAEQLALTSKYKSEFLANMSHELRTPLNSLLILSEQLSKNPEGNLNHRQVEFARTIHSSGHDLLMLINDILDLSKIESGTVAVDIGPLRLADLQRYVERTFRHVAEAKQLDFAVNTSLRPAAALRTDAKRLQQILRNLLSNAFKFTHHGRVRLSIDIAGGGWSPDHARLRAARRVIAFSVSDTGIGISGAKQQIIFEAFQQADGSTSRKYGGTGLGLAISRELARLLGGEIRLASAPGQGSTFTLYLPVQETVARAGRRAAPPGEGRVAPPRRKRGVVPCVRGGREPQPPAPQQVSDGVRPGDPVLLVAGADHECLRDVREAGRRAGWQVRVARGGAEALLLATQAAPQAVALGPGLPDMPVGRLLRRLRLDPAFTGLPACVLAAPDWQSARLESALHGLAACFGPPPPPGPAGSLAGLRALVVDDDMRNIFALATVLEEHGMEIVWADNGREAIQRVAGDPSIAVALLDVMMPELDGLATLREIRRLPRGRELPVIAVTARAMKGDREKCIAAGAWDYLSKPVDPQALLAVLRAWLTST